MVRILADEDVAALLDLEALFPVIATAFRKQGRGAVERPERPHFPVGSGPDGADSPPQAGTALTMPAYIHGADVYATKLASVHEGNPERGLPTVQAQIALTDADTGCPRAFMAGNQITNARTAAIGGLAGRELGIDPAVLGVVGAGTQARWQARAIAAAVDLERVRIHSPSESRFECARELDDELPVPVSAADSPREGVRDATIVVTATTATDPVVPAEGVRDGALIVAVGAYTPEMRELDAATVTGADRVFGDVPAEVRSIGDIREADVDPDAIAPFADVLLGEAGRASADETIIVESVGSAVLDAAAAEHVFERARSEDVGLTVPLD